MFFLLGPCTTEQWLPYNWWYAYSSLITQVYAKQVGLRTQLTARLTTHILVYSLHSPTSLGARKFKYHTNIY
jgi:hypothetical protein